MRDQQPAPVDTLYQLYDRNLFRLAGADDSVMNTLQNNPNANLSGSVNVPPDSIGSGYDTGTTDQGAGSLQAGQQRFNDNVDGYWIGVDPISGKGQISIGPSGGNHLSWDGNSLTIIGGVSIDSLDIPDITTANSFHVDTGGNSWWGANVASGYNSANAYILATGAAVFRNVAIGGTSIQYVITNSGIFSFGDGQDGAGTCDGSTAVTGMSRSGSTYTLTRDVYFNTLTVNAAVIVKHGGYRIFVKDTLTVNGTIHANGTAGNTGGDGGNDGGSGPGGGGTGGTGTSAGYLTGSTSGANGKTAATFFAAAPAASNGTSVSNSLGTDGLGGGGGGSGSQGNAGASSVGGTATTANVRLTVGVQLAQLLDVSSSGTTVKYTSSAGSGGGNGGSAGTQLADGGGGGGGGSAGGMMAIYARTVIIGAAGVISSNGGNGGNGGAGSPGQPQRGAGGGGGGGGGNGGVLVMVYNQLVNSGSITVTHGTKGSGGAGGVGSIGNGGAGSDGTDGSDGTIYQFQLSL